jgi:hypothetical protein
LWTVVDKSFSFLLYKRRGTHDVSVTCYGNDETYQSHPAIKKEPPVITKVLKLQLAFGKKQVMMSPAYLLEDLSIL